MKHKLPFVDLSFHLDRPEPEDCRLVADALENTGLLIVGDPRRKGGSFHAYREAMVEYFRQPEAAKRPDEVLPAHQTGWTPGRLESARWSESLAAFVEGLPDGQRPVVELFTDGNGVVRTVPDAKERFFFPPDEVVIPEAFPELAWLAPACRNALLETAVTVLEMAAIGLGLAPDAFTRHMHGAPHLLATTGSDLSAYADGALLAGFHRDLNLLTAHAKSNYPGLAAWTRDGRRFEVEGIPDGCILVQVANMLEILTAGKLKSCFHEVLAPASDHLDRVAELAAGKAPWRVSVTLFAHMASDALLVPLPEFQDRPEAAGVEPIRAGTYVYDELRALGLLDG